MALRSYATEILGNKVAIAALRSLLRFTAEVFTVRELARISGFSHPEVSKVLKEFERMGVIRLQPVGRAYQVTLNEESYILQSMIKPIFKAEEETIKVLISEIKPFFKNEKILSVAIFGSVARGMEKRTSDLDLLVIAENKEIAIERIAEASERTIARFGIALSPLVMTRNQFAAKSNRSLIGSILESYVHVYGKDLRQMVLHGKGSR